MAALSGFWVRFLRGLLNKTSALVENFLVEIFFAEDLFGLSLRFS